MNRYQMLKESTSPQELKTRAYRFKPSASSTQVCGFLKKCAQDGVALDAGSISTGVLDSAVMKLSKELGIPIVTKSKNVARLLAMTFSSKLIFALEDLPKGFQDVICYWDLSSKDIPDDVHIYLALVINETEDRS